VRDVSFKSNRTVVERLSLARNYLRSIHAACLHVDRPTPGHVILIDDEAGRTYGLEPGGYTLVAEIDGIALLSPITVSPRGELEYSDRLVRSSIRGMSAELIVGRESMILPA
jgi:hypothetical protein